MRTLRDIVIELISEVKDGYVTNKEKFLKKPEIVGIKLYDCEDKKDIWFNKDMEFQYTVNSFNEEEEVIKDMEQITASYRVFKQEIEPYMLQATKIQLNERLNENLPEKKLKQKVNKI